MAQKSSYAIALGSNRRHGRHRAPGETLHAALARLKEMGLAIEAISAVHVTRAQGPAGRSFANAAAIVTTPLAPDALLALLQQVEREFGRRGGRRWGARVLDLDILLWSEGAFEAPGLVVPHPQFRGRAFVLDPLAQIAPDWSDPLTGRSVRQLRARLRRPCPVDRRRARTYGHGHMGP